MTSATPVLNKGPEMSCEDLIKYPMPDFENGIAHLTNEEQHAVLQLKQLECSCRMKSAPAVLTGTYCNRTWDRVLCWDDTPPGTTVYQPCPGYINNFKTFNDASRTCLEDGTWFIGNSRRKKGWTNYTACLNNDTLQEDDPFDDPNDDEHEVPDLYKKHLDNIQMMCNVGYGISLILLLLAFAIIIYFKKLRCTRNTMHLNLFASFILRAALSLVRDVFMVGGLAFPEDVVYDDSGKGFVFKEGRHWGCRIFFCAFYYAVAASYTWVFIEALYIHMKIFVSVFDRKMKIWWYFLLGWSYPFLVIVCLSIARYYLDNNFCWNTFNTKGLLWIYQGPIMLTVVINFILFINTIRIVNTKLKAPHCSNSKRTRIRTLARSIFFLVPTFGAYFILFTIPMHHLNETADFVMLSIEMFLNSFQGSLLAIVLCFLNTEVRKEIRRFWYRRKASITSMRRLSTTSLRGEVSRTSRTTRLDSYRSDRLNSATEQELKELAINYDRRSPFMDKREPRNDIQFRDEREYSDEKESDNELRAFNNGAIYKDELLALTKGDNYLQEDSLRAINSTSKYYLDEDEISVANTIVNKGKTTSGESVAMTKRDNNFKADEPEVEDYLKGLLNKTGPEDEVKISSESDSRYTPLSNGDINANVGMTTEL